ncbi:2-oxoisovalerate dehydrogenase E1 component [Friedmanniella luteola]|uniref:2-oxoisovalerate dehydrogenase E1 component n=1 Tax=Friedmanniella luteola TaxID=546871 RepID=A0A1H1YN25_9ACTN|nr:thiamine pyrophosphate-dependent enzyme [Friedmanniella luteola]SDT22813.1 2-oxoisovalerate dehydrogenase E1 component [Friedmanniella luteola]
MHPLDAYLRAALADVSAPVVAPATTDADTSAEWWEGVFDAQATSRHLDLVARELQAEGEGFYTIGSAGHEANALVAAALRPTDPALLHYRSGGFYAARAAQVPGSTPVRDVLQGVMGLADEPIAGGRHKVFGHPDLAVIPQTSTIASHLPRAVGLALALHRAHRLGVDCPWPRDAVVVASFGDASANHSTLTGAVGTALNAAHRGLDVPLLLVCEDNGYGISVPTPAGWVEHAYGSRPGLDYRAVDGSDPATAWPRIAEAAARVRRRRRPLFLHLRTVRYLGHAGSDAEVSYRTPRAIEADYARDPLLGTARVLAGLGRTPAELLGRYSAARAAVDAEATRLRGGRRLGSAPEVMAPLAPRRPERVAVAARAYRPSPGAAGRTLAESVNAALAAILEADRRVLVFGEDVGVKGGVYGVTGGLARRFGAARVFDSVLDEQSILGMGLGAALAGLVPVPEIQYLAYLHNAEDQLRGEAATLRFFSSGRFPNPLVVRVAGLAYQRGFGGHFHNDNALGVLRDIPGLVLACPSRGDDAAAMLRTCVAAAATDGTVAVFLEPIALYHRRDLHAPGDGGWLSADDAGHVPVGAARLHPAGAAATADLTLVSFGNGVPMSLRVARRLAGHGVRADVLDLRWLAPLPVEDLLAAARTTGRVLVVDETRHTGGVGEGVVTALVEHGFGGAVARVSSADSFVPLGPAAAHVLLDEDEIEKAALTLAGGGAGP